MKLCESTKQSTSETAYLPGNMQSLRQTYDKPRQRIKKQRHHFANKGPYSQSYGFSSWTIKDEHQRIDAFKLWCWRRLLRVLWTARRSNLSVLKEINPEYSSEGLMLKLKLQYFSHLMQRTESWKREWCWERLKAGGEGMTEDEMVGWHHQCDGREF